SAAEAIKGLRVHVEPALTVPPRKQPGAGSIEHVFVNGTYVRHVGELQQPVCCKGFVTRIGSEPFVAFAAGFKPDEFFVRNFEQISSFLNGGGIHSRMREEILLSHHHRITGGTRLLETAVRLAKQRLKRV